LIYLFLPRHSRSTASARLPRDQVHYIDEALTHISCDLQAESSVDIPPDEKLPGILLLLVHPDVAIRAWALE
jgi:hypothetical protein